MRDDRLEKYRSSVTRICPVVFCVRCGSTNLDQNSITELRCYDCEQTLAWDGRLFSIARNGAVADVKQAFKNRERES